MAIGLATTRGHKRIGSPAFALSRSTEKGRKVRIYTRREHDGVRKLESKTTKEEF
jgi:hypothetical protein